MKKIDELTVTAWQKAIENVATVINRKLGTHYNSKDNWNALEDIAMNLGIRFDENGNIKK